MLSFMPVHETNPFQLKWQKIQHLNFSHSKMYGQLGYLVQADALVLETPDLRAVNVGDCVDS